MDKSSCGVSSYFASAFLIELLVLSGACTHSEDSRSGEALLDTGVGDGNEDGLDQGTSTQDEGQNSGGVDAGPDQSSEPNSNDGESSKQGNSQTSSENAEQADDNGDEKEDENRDEDKDEDDGKGPIFDVETPDAGELPPVEEELVSYIWIANSAESTVSKIATRTLIEKGRYITRPDANGNPSRTSVALSGAAAVANRWGGITKIYADTKKCEDKNGNGRLDTATDANFLAWDEEECVAWHIPMAYGSQRGLAWAQGDFDPETGEISNEQLWVTGVSEGMSSLDVIRLHGDDGAEIGRTSVNLASSPGATAFPYGGYGGAVDSKRNFWFSNLTSGMIARVNYNDFSYRKWAKPHSSYGMTVDSKDRVWSCEWVIGRFTPETESWDTISGDFGSPLVQAGATGGCMLDGEGRVWKSARMRRGGNGVIAIDWETLAVVKAIPLPAHTHGISIDFDGFVWGVSVGSQAYKVDPDAETFETFGDLVGAYTYSDMTGFALAAVSPGPID